MVAMTVFEKSKNSEANKVVLPSRKSARVKRKIDFASLASGKLSDNNNNAKPVNFDTAEADLDKRKVVTTKHLKLCKDKVKSPKKPSVKNKVESKSNFVGDGIQVMVNSDEELDYEDDVLLHGEDDDD